MRWRYQETVLTLCTLAFFATMVGRLAISPVVPLITDDFAVSNSAIGVALTGMWIAYSASQFPSGVLADRFGERLVILVAIGGTAIASLVLAVAPLFVLFVFGTIALGAVAGLHYSVATTLLTRTYDNLGTAIGIHNTGSPAAGLIAPPIVAWIGVRYGWRTAVATGAVMAAPVVLLFAWRIRPTEPRRPDQPMADRFELAPLFELLARPKIAFPTLLAIFCTFVWQATASFLPTFLVFHRGQSAEFAGLVFAGYFVVQSPAQIGIGWLSDHYGRDFATAGCMVLGVAGFGLLIAVPGLLALALAILLIGTGLSYQAALFPRFMDVLSAEERAAGFGLVRSVYGIVAGVGSVVTGVVADAFGWDVAFAVLAVMLAIVCSALVVNWALSLGY
jgi:predicted MFS family arabinose efflux permease